jgi:cbb3-type cytochrome oxidase subunit 3
MTVAARRDMLMMFQTLCQSAGLKLHAVTPRLFGFAQAVERAVNPDPTPLKPNQLNVVLLLGTRWAELCFFKGDRLLQAQSLANGPMLVSEVKRNLAVFQAQYAVNVELSGPDCMYVFGDPTSVVQALQSGQHLPIRMLDPLADEPKIAAELDNPSHFAGGVGLASVWSQSGEKPVNLIAPKRSSKPVSVSRQRGMFYGAAVGALALFFIAFMWYVLAQKKAEIAKLNQQKLELEEAMKDKAQERADLEAYIDWQKTTVPWLDEMYDLSARFPWEKDFRINQFSATATTASAGLLKKNAKDANAKQYIGKINLNGIYPEKNDRGLNTLTQMMTSDKHLVPRFDGNLKPKEFSLKIDIAKQPASAYASQLIVPPPLIKTVTRTKIVEKKVEVKMDDPDPNAEPIPNPDPNAEPEPNPDPNAEPEPNPNEENKKGKGGAK